MCSKLVLVGDPCQLQAVVKSKVASEYGYGQSLLKRFCVHFNAQTQGLGMFTSWYSRYSDIMEHFFVIHSFTENPIHVLKLQYRMYPEICDFPSRHFYNKLLMPDK